MIELDGKVIGPSFKERFKRLVNRFAARLFIATKYGSIPLPTEPKIRIIFSVDVRAFRHSLLAIMKMLREVRV